MSSAKPNNRRALAWGLFAVATVGGWLAILAGNRMRISPPVVMLALGWLAVTAGAWFLWRTAMAVADRNDPSWWAPPQKIDELHREKRALLKAIKEVEFDEQMGKQSSADAKAINAQYRARAIEVIKAIEQLEASGASDVRAAIAAEVKARLAVSQSVEQGVKKSAAKQQNKANRKQASKAKPAAAAAADTAADTDTAADAVADTDTAADAAAAADTDADTAAAAAADADAVTAAAADTAAAVTAAASAAPTKEDHPS